MRLEVACIAQGLDAAWQRLRQRFAQAHHISQ
jgi:hypothetical protein